MPELLTKPIVHTSPSLVANITRRIVRWFLLMRRALKDVKGAPTKEERERQLAQVRQAVALAMEDTETLVGMVRRLDMKDLVALSNDLSRQRFAKDPELMSEIVRHRYPTQTPKMTEQERVRLFAKNEIGDLTKAIKEALMNMERTLEEQRSGAVDFDAAVKAASNEALIVLGELATFVARLRDFLKKFATGHKVEESRYKLQRAASRGLTFSSEEEALRYLATLTGKRVVVP